MEHEGHLRVLYLYQILLRYSDTEHPLSTNQIMQMMDAVESSRFISERKTRELVGKLVGMASESDDEKLKRNIYTAG